MQGVALYVWWYLQKKLRSMSEWLSILMRTRATNSRYELVSNEIHAGQLVRGADDGIKPGVERSETPGSST